MNKVFLIGNLTKDPDLRTTSGGASVCSFRIAVSRRFSNQQGERETDYFDIVAWRALGENCGKYLAKGRKVAVCGELRTRTYDAKDGTKRYVTEIQADDVEFLTPKDGSNNANSNYAPQGQPPADTGADGFADIDDDELPF